MSAIIDTSSLLALVRYYLPFDKNNLLRDYIQTLFESGELIILDKVASEAKYLSQGLILKELSFISATPSFITKTTNLIPSNKFFNLLENQFCNREVMKLKEITAVEFEVEKSKYLLGADANIILFALTVKKNSPIIVTEETKNANDNKIFRKIPDSCSSIGIPCCSVPTLLKEHYNLDISALFK